MHCPACSSQDVLVDESGVFECNESLSGCGWLRGDVSALYSIPGELIKRIQAVRGGYSFREWILMAIEAELEKGDS
jgi:hypothetical protein